MKSKKTEPITTKQLKNLLDQCTDQEFGTVDYEQFGEMVSELLKVGWRNR